LSPDSCNRIKNFYKILTFLLLPWLRQKGYEIYVDMETVSFLNIEGFSRSEIPSLSDFIVVLDGDGRRLRFYYRSSDRKALRW